MNPLVLNDVIKNYKQFRASQASTSGRKDIRPPIGEIAEASISGRIDVRPLKGQAPCEEVLVKGRSPRKELPCDRTKGTIRKIREDLRGIDLDHLLGLGR
ncbi:hypothetical protein ACOSQ2_010094 [Xanthoceras sorbifolium]